MTISTLIDKVDVFEAVRDKIALILATESAAQQVLASAAAEDPDLWELRVYTERTNPWEAFRGDDTDRSPIINVWFENSGFPRARGNVVSKQESGSTYNIDCYGYAVAANVVAGGYTPGDEGAALEVQRAVRLVRNILMAGHYVYLDLPRGTVSGRWLRTVNMFQPQIDNRAVEKVVGCRLALDVSFNEYSPQVGDTAETLDYVAVDVKRTEDGQIVVETDFDYTP
jgi:hypothetical protein